MPKYQGVYRLKKGFRRALNVSELRRGYFFLTADTNIGDILGNTFDVYLDNELIITETSIDNFGRITGATSLIKRLGSSYFTVITHDGKVYVDIET